MLNETAQSLADAISVVIELVGIAVIVVGAIIATGGFGRALGRRVDPESAYRLYRRALGRSILLGLEFLVAADIIRTVAIRPTLESLAVLAVIVLIRTFLSFALEVEMDGVWPWDRRRAEARRGEGPTP